MRNIMFFLCVFLFVFMASCAMPLPAGKPSGTVHGIVTLGPICPVVSDPPDPECLDRAYQPEGQLEVVDDGGHVVQRLSVNADGTFQFEVPSGSYTIVSGEGTRLPYCSSERFSVELESVVELAVFCDTGIR